MFMDLPVAQTETSEVSSQQRILAPAIQSIWAYPLLIAAAEALPVIVNPQAGLIAHLLLLLALIIHRALARREAEQNLALALLLAPLTRVLSLSLPLDRFPQIAWYAVVAVPLLISTWMVIRRLRLARQELGLQPGGLLLQLMVGAGGLVLGASAYAVLQPALPTGDLSLRALWLPAIALLLCTGFTEEIIFRGVLQAAALPALGRWAVVYVALLFAALQIGYLSPWYLLLAASAGLVFGYVVRWSGSILGVALAHGLANVTLLLVMPYLADNPSSEFTNLAPWILGSSLLLAAIAVAILSRTRIVRQTNIPATTNSANASLTVQAVPQITLTPAPAVRNVSQPAQAAPQITPTPAARVRAKKAPRQMPTPSPAPMSATAIRALRLQRGIKYVDLAQRCGIPVRVLAEIEHGIRPLLLDQRDRIVSALNLAV